MRTFCVAVLTLVLSTMGAQAEDGLVKKLRARGAAEVGEDMLPTQLLVFGNPAIGTQLMTSQRTVGIDLPIKVLIWEEADGRVWIAYNDPAYLAERHGIKDRRPVLEKMKAAISGIVSAAASP